MKTANKSTLHCYIRNKKKSVVVCFLNNIFKAQNVVSICYNSFYCYEGLCYPKCITDDTKLQFLEVSI